MAASSETSGPYAPLFSLVMLYVHSQFSRNPPLEAHTTECERVLFSLPIFLPITALNGVTDLFLRCSTEDSMAVVEEWMYSNTFLVDLEESFARWRLLESSLPVRPDFAPLLRFELLGSPFHSSFAYRSSTALVLAFQFSVCSFCLRFRFADVSYVSLGWQST